MNLPTLLSPQAPLVLSSQDKGNVWLHCNGKIYDIGQYRRCSIKSPLMDRIKTVNREVKLPRIFDLFELEIATTNYQSTVIMAALTLSRDISIGFEIKYPDDSSVGIVIKDIFAGQFFPDMEYGADKIPITTMKIQLFGKDTTRLNWTNEPPFTKENENFRLTHPLLQLIDCVKEFTDRETQPRRHGAPAIQRTTDMLHLQHNPHKGSK